LTRAASGAGVQLSAPGFEMDAPGPDFFADHAVLYWTQGQRSYDPTVQVPK